MEFNVPRPPIKSINDLTLMTERTRTNERANIRPLLTPRAIARGACGHSPSTTEYYLAAWITPYGFPVSSQGVVTLGEGLATGA